MALKTGWEFDPKFSGRPREEAERHRRRAELFGAQKSPPEGPSRAERRKALIEDHRASEHLFKPASESTHGAKTEEELLAERYGGRNPDYPHKSSQPYMKPIKYEAERDVIKEGWKEYAGRVSDQATLHGFKERYNIALMAGHSPAAAHDYAAVETARASNAPISRVYAAAKRGGLGKHDGGPASMEAEDERRYAAAERAKYDARVGAGRFAASSRESREKFLKDVDKHGLDTALLRHGEREPHLGDRPLKDPQKEQLARLSKARMGLGKGPAMQTGPKGGKFYYSPASGTKIYVR